MKKHYERNKHLYMWFFVCLFGVFLVSNWGDGEVVNFGVVVIRAVVLFVFTLFGEGFREAIRRQ